MVAVSNGHPFKVVGVAVSYSEADNCVVRADAASPRPMPMNSKAGGSLPPSETSPTSSSCGLSSIWESTPTRSKSWK